MTTTPSRALTFNLMRQAHQIGELFTVESILRQPIGEGEDADTLQGAIELLVDEGIIHLEETIATHGTPAEKRYRWAPNVFKSR